jgi:o-succinylbenzoate synthase
MKATFSHLELHFKRPAGTSRGVMQVKNSWILKLSDGIHTGTGEISVIEGLSPDFKDIKSFEEKIVKVCSLINNGQLSIVNLGLEDDPSIKFGVETALLDLQNGGKGIIFNNDFTKGKKKIPINGLVWMGDEAFMQEQIQQKLNDGFSTIKMKIGAIDLETELELLQSIRANYSAEQITLRVDANGVFSPHQAIDVLKKLADLEIHSIEQPIKAGQWQAMKELCASTPTPIALDEELIGINDRNEKINLLDTIQPQYIILKPSLHGGISGTQEWIELAEERNIPWWITSALESNIGLDAICQLTTEYSNELPQGLGTGSLYTNNIDSDLVVENGFIFKKMDN